MTLRAAAAMILFKKRWRSAEIVYKQFCMAKLDFHGQETAKMRQKRAKLGPERLPKFDRYFDGIKENLTGCRRLDRKKAGTSYASWHGGIFGKGDVAELPKRVLSL